MGPFWKISWTPASALAERSISFHGAVIRGAFLLLIFSVPLYFSVQLTNYNLPKTVLTQILVSFLLFVWFFRMASTGDFSFRPGRFSYPLLAYFVIAIFSLPLAINWAGGLRLLGQMVSYGMVYFIVLNGLREEETETWALALTLAGTLVSLYGILQSAGIEPLLKGYEYLPYIPVSSLGHRNLVAQYLILLIPLAGVETFLTASPYRKVFFGLGAVLMMWCLYVTRSRGGLLGFLAALFIGVGILFYRRVRNRGRGATLWWVVCVSVPVVVIGLAGLLGSSDSMTLKARHINPSGYYLGSVEGTLLSGHPLVQIALDFQVVAGDPQKPGSIDLYGEYGSSPPIVLNPSRDGWNHVDREVTLPSAALRAAALHLRWVPGSESSVLKVREISVRVKGGGELLKRAFLQRLFLKLGVAEVDKVLSSQARLHLYHNTISMIREHPLLGVGFGNFKYAYPHYRNRTEWALSGLNTRVDEAHNEYLQVLAEVGLLGLLAFLWILLILGRMSFWMVRKEETGPRFFIGLACTTAILATLVQSLFDFNLQNPASGVTFWMAVACLEVAYEGAREKKGLVVSPSVSFSIPSRPARALLAVGATIGLLVAITVSLRPVAADYHLKWGRFHMQGGEWERALNHLESAARYSPREADVFFHLGQTYTRTKDFKRAMEAYRRCIALHPYFIEARNNLGTVYIKVGRTDDAMEEFKRSIEINPYHPGLHNNLGYLYGKRNLVQQAAEAYERALSLDPENVEAHKNLGLLYLHRLKNVQRGQAYLEKYLAMNPGDPQADLIRKEIEALKNPGRSP